MNKLKLLTATVLSSFALVALGVAAIEANPMRVGAEVGYACDGGAYEPIIDLGESDSAKALKTALSGGGETSLKNNQISKKDENLNKYFDCNISANVKGENTYSLDHNTLIIKNKGNITITFNSSVTRAIVQVAAINNEADLNNLQYQQKVFGDGSTKITSITINGSDFGKCQYLLIGKLTFRVAA